MPTDDAQEKWYYHVASGKVVHGKAGPWEDRMGPYESEEDARQALARAAERSQAFDDEDDDWNA